MNLKKLLEMQKPLREQIIKKHNLEGQDLFPNMNLALLVEVGELANNWRGFKHWSVDREPRTYSDEVCKDCQGYGRIENVNIPFGFEPVEIDCPKCKGQGIIEKNPLLEEYADCLSFILELGLETGLEIADEYEQYQKANISGQFLFLFDVTSFFYYHRNQKSYERIIRVFLGLGAMLGFDWEQIEQAYLQKNAINHQRQEEGY
ncbi:dUTP diphosphatase [Neobacillus niacini]|uniref:dUTP diphosphatase n=1 Tax=Neobacillus niacini TaxID=86668 RepID=UPI0030004F50